MKKEAAFYTIMSIIIGFVPLLFLGLFIEIESLIFENWWILIPFLCIYFAGITACGYLIHKVIMAIQTNKRPPPITESAFLEIYYAEATTQLELKNGNVVTIMDEKDFYIIMSKISNRPRQFAINGFLHIYDIRNRLNSIMQIISDYKNRRAKKISPKEIVQKLEESMEGIEEDMNYLCQKNIFPTKK